MKTYVAIVRTDTLSTAEVEETLTAALNQLLDRAGSRAGSSSGTAIETSLRGVTAEHGRLGHEVLELEPFPS